MIKIAPSILSADFTCLGKELDTIKTADLIHFDVMDGTFVPNISFGLPVLKAVNKYTDAILDVHLMTHKPERLVADFANAGADIISIHLESDDPKGIRKAMDAMTAVGVKKAVALRPITNAKAILPYIDEIDMVLVMTVEPGFGGQALIVDQLDTIREVKTLIDRYHPGIEIEVDGGINSNTAGLVKEAGANILVAGSAVFGAEDRAAAIAALKG